MINGYKVKSVGLYVMVRTSADENNTNYLSA